MAKLYELTTAYAQLESMLDDPNADETQITQWLDECQGALREKAVDIIAVVKNLEATAAAIGEAEKRMADRRKAIAARAESVRGYILRNMQAADILKIECPLFVISRRKNPPSGLINDESAVPVAYLRQPPIPPPPDPKPDKKAILDDMKQGVIVDGCELVQGERLEIK